MKKRILYLLAGFLMLACSTRNNKFLNRNFHALVVKYNVLYNGEVAFKDGVAEVEQKYYDDFSKNIPVEPFSFYVNETSQKEGEENVIGKEKFDRAEDKATKAIQKHSMLIDGAERNYQIDDAYVLLGKSRYYTKRFGPALEAFEYVIKNYDNSNLIYETVIWRAKANIHVGNTAFAIRALKKLMTTAKLDAKTSQEAALGIAIGYERYKDSLPQLKKYLEVAVKAYPKGQSAARANYLLAQIFKTEGKLESANECLKAIVTNKQALYKFKVQAQLDLINNTPKMGYVEASKQIKKMLRKQSNRLYVGIINYQKGLLNDRVDSVEIAQKSFQIAVNNSEKDLYVKSKSYEKLGDIAFKQKKYVRSKKMYDSILAITRNKETDFYKKIHTKANGLNKIVTSIENIKQYDSLLKIAMMDEVAASKFFEKHIEVIKENDRKQRLKELSVIEKQNAMNASLGQEEQAWYFYNSRLLELGRTVFMKKWNAARRDNNWYAASLFVMPGTAYKNATSKTLVGDDTKEYGKYDVLFYTSKINRQPRFLDSISKQQAIYQYELANAYYDKLKEKELAIHQFKTLLKGNPDENLIVGTYYKLYKIGEETKDESLQQQYKTLLLTQYPTNSFTRLTNQSKEEELLTDEWSPEKCYEAIYELYKLFLTVEADEELKIALMDYKGTQFEPKFLLLNAYVKARLDGKDVFLKKLKELQMQFPNSIEAKKAAELLSKIK